MLKPHTLFALTAVIALALAPALYAQEDEPTGQLTVSMNSDYAKVYVGGEHWESVEFERAGKVVVIKDIDLSTEPIVVKLAPVYDNLEPVILELKIKDFKRKRVKRMYILAAKRKVKFPKSKTVKPQPVPEEEPERKTPKVVPG
ncbi:MAG: hypothetical protein QF464_20275, partial [Myxococcota bacterium]|nr:hypothetical protein [Myxococcota bacterium]